MRTANIADRDLVSAFKPQERERLILEQLPQVKLVSRRVYDRLPDQFARGLRPEDLISAGIAGLMSAADRFDATASVRFENYARYMIKDAILSYLRGLDSRQLGKLQADMVATRRAVPKPLWTHALKTFGSSALAADWFQTECGALNNRAPIDTMGDESGRREVDRVLGCLDYGMLA